MACCALTHNASILAADMRRSLSRGRTVGDWLPGVKRIIPPARGHSQRGNAVGRSEGRVAPTCAPVCCPDVTDDNSVFPSVNIAPQSRTRHPRCRLEFLDAICPNRLAFPLPQEELTSPTYATDRP